MEEIRRRGANEAEYPAFAGIRWGFAEVSEGRLETTEKWNRFMDFDGFGEKRTWRSVEKVGRETESVGFPVRNGVLADLDFRSEDEMVS